MNNSSKIKSLSEKVQLANTANSKERQIVSNSCRELYNIIEEALFNKYGTNAITDAYNDLCNGDFAEPYHCEMKKEKFELYSVLILN
jgi:hypothetical protein